MQVGRQASDRRGNNARQELHPGAGELRVQAIGKNRAEQRHPERAAERAKQHGAGGRHAEMLVIDAVLHGDDEHLHDHAHAEPEPQRVDRGLPVVALEGEQRQRGEAEGHGRRAENGKELVAPEAADDAPADHRGREHAEHHRHEQQAGARREEGHRAEQREPDNQSDPARDREIAVGKEGHRQDRLARAQLDGDEGKRRRNGNRDEAEHHRRAPRKGRAAEPGKEDGGAERRSEQDRADVIDRVAPPRRARRQHGGDHRHRQNAGRQIDVENPAPA